MSMKLSLRKKLLFINFALLLIFAIAASLISIYHLQKYFKSRIYEELTFQAEMFEYLLAKPIWYANEWRGTYRLLQGIARSANIRLTLISAEGEVLFDSWVALDSLVQVENHLMRPEVQQALRARVGSAERISATVNKPLFYVAIRKNPLIELQPPFANVTFIRVATLLDEVQQTLSDIRYRIVLGSLLGIFLISGVGYYVSRKMAEPIVKLAAVAQSVKEGNLQEARFEPIPNDEIGELATLLNQMLQKLREDFKQMQILQKMRSQFLGNVSHELRTPIFALQGYLETLLHQDIDPHKRREFTEKAYKLATRLNNLLTDLIDISRIESGEMQMSFRYFNLASWLDQLCQEFQNKARKNQVELSFQPESDGQAEVTVLGDMERLTQVMQNLINNAIKYNVPGGKVIIGYRQKPEGTEIFVRDTGQGIEAEHLPRIFERFYRVDKERSRAVGGTGLGLAIVKHIVEAHGSSVHVRSKPGEGSEFSFILKSRSHL